MKTNSKNQFATKNDLQKFKEEIKTAVRDDIKQHKDEMKNYVGALHERFSDQVAVIAEQHVDIDRNLIGIKKHLGQVDQHLDKLEIKTEVLMETVAEIKMDTTMIREENKVDQTKTKKLEHRVAVLETRA